MYRTKQNGRDGLSSTCMHRGCDGCVNWCGWVSGEKGTRIRIEQVAIYTESVAENLMDP